MTRSDAAGDIAPDCHDSSQSDSRLPAITADRERQSRFYAERRQRRRRDEKTNSFFGVGLSILVIILVTQVASPGSEGPIHWLDIDPGELSLDAILVLDPAPPTEHGDEEAAREAASNADRQHLLTAEAAVLDAERWDEESVRAEDQSDRNDENGRTAALEPMPIIKAEDLQRADSTADLASTFQLLAAPSLPDAHGLDQAPKLVTESVNLRYPWEALKRGIQGLVVVHFFIDSSGRTSSIRVLESSCPPCDGAAIEAIAEARFTPGRQNGKNVGTYTRLGIRFILN